MSGWVRQMLVGIALGLTVLFAVAAWLNPVPERRLRAAHGNAPAAGTAGVYVQTRHRLSHVRRAA